MDGLLKRLPTVSKCCCCLPIDVGTLVIGYLEFIGGVIQFISDCVGLAGLGASEKSGIGAYVVDIILQAIIVLISLFLILGVHKKNPRYVFLWLFSVIIWVVLKLISAILFVCLGYISSFFGFIIYAVIQCYLIIVVNSVYQDYENGTGVNY